MKVRLTRLVLYCRSSVEELDLDHDVVTFAGALNTGKSSTLHLIDFCLGASRPYDTEALKSELLSVRLELRLGRHNVIIEREQSAQGAMVTWMYPGGDPKSAFVPIRELSDSAEILDGAKTLSDMLFVLSGLEVVRVRKAPSDPESDMIRLSFRDLLFYCFVRQRTSDSDFFHLGDNARQKSRDAIRFVCGFNSARLAALEARLEGLRQTRATNELSVEQIATVLKEVSGATGYAQLVKRESEIEAALEIAVDALDSASKGYTGATHIADEMRQTLRGLVAEVTIQERALLRQTARIAELRELRAEFYNLKYKTDRSEVALSVLGDARFEYCPQCTREIEPDLNDDTACVLCKSSSETRGSLTAEYLEASRRDLNERLIEVEHAIEQHLDSAERERDRLQRLQRRKELLDRELTEVLRRYDTDYVERFRQGKRDKARLAGELGHVQKLMLIHRNLSSLRSRSQNIESELAVVRKAIEDERRSLTKAHNNVEQIEEAFIENLREVGIPGVDVGDRAVINTRTWLPRIENRVDPGSYWDFDSPGSNGRRVLFSVNYALAVHQVAERNDLPLPSLLLLDTPTKDVGRDANLQLHDAMDERMYSLALGGLRGTQLIVADGSFAKPPDELDVKQYNFSREAGLIGYYTE